MQYLTCVVFINLVHYYGKRPCQPCVSQSHLYTSLVPRPMIVVFGLVTRLHVHMRTTLENGVLCNGQQPQSVVNGFCKFEAMKTLIGRRAPRCDKDQFRAKMTVSTQTVCEISLLKN